MNNRFFILLFSLLFGTVNLNAQFYTVSRKKNIIHVTNTHHNSREKEANAPETKKPDQLLVKADSVNTEQLFSLPLNHIRITSPYGKRKDPFSGKTKRHYGIDLAARAENVKALMPGKIVKIGFEKKGLGNYVKIKHGDFETIYGHLHTSIGTEGDLVNAGTVIGLSGSTGRSTGEHLHLAIKYKNEYIDPKLILGYIEDIKKIKKSEKE